MFTTSDTGAYHWTKSYLSAGPRWTRPPTQALISCEGLPSLKITHTSLNPYQTKNSVNRSNSQQLKSRCLWVFTGAKAAEIRFITNAFPVVLGLVFFSQNTLIPGLDVPLPVPAAILTGVNSSVREGKWSHATKGNYFKFVAKWLLVKPVWWTTEHSVH